MRVLMAQDETMPLRHWEMMQLDASSTQQEQEVHFDTGLIQLPKQDVVDQHAIEQQHLLQAQQRMQHILNAIEQKLDIDLLSLEHAVVRLSGAIAEQLLKHELSTHPEKLQHIVRAALQLIPGESRCVSVAVCPEDFGLLKEMHLGSGHSVMTIDWVEDANLQPGDCRIESPNMDMDATVKTRLQEIMAQLLGADQCT